MKIKRFKISREQAVSYAADLSVADPIFATEDIRSTLLGKMLAGKCTFDGVPVKVIT